MDIKHIIETLKVELQSQGKFFFRDMEEVGKDLMVTCPFHANGQESTPSFGITTEEKITAKGVIPVGTCNCFACGAKMGISRLVSTLRNEEELDSIEWLTSNFGFVDQQTLIEGVAPIMFDDRLELNPQEYFNPTLPYIKQRGIEERTAREFMLGYSSKYDALVIPVFDKFNVCRMMIQRSISSKRFYNTSGSEKESLLFGIDKIYKYYEYVNKTSKVYIVESAIDAMRLWQLNKPAVATMQAIPSDGQIKALKSFIDLLQVQTLVIATDNDEAGQRATGDYVKHFSGKINLERYLFPQGAKDIGDLQDSQLLEEKTMKVGVTLETQRQVGYNLGRL